MVCSNLLNKVCIKTCFLDAPPSLLKSFVLFLPTLVFEPFYICMCARQMYVFTHKSAHASIMSQSQNSLCLSLFASYAYSREWNLNPVHRESMWVSPRAEASHVQQVTRFYITFSKKKKKETPHVNIAGNNLEYKQLSSLIHACTSVLYLCCLHHNTIFFPSSLNIIHQQKKVKSEHSL